MTRLSRRTLFAGLAGALAAPGPDCRADEKWTTIAWIAGMDRITQVHIMNLLGRQKIALMMEGSKGAGLTVSSEQAAPAMKLLKQDATKLQYSITFSDGSKVRPPANDMKDYAVNKRYADALKAGRGALPAELVAVLRCAEAVKAAEKYPLIVRIHVRPRSYMRPNGKMGSAFEGEIELADRSQKAGARKYFQVWDGGKQISWQGGSEWREGL